MLEWVTRSRLPELTQEFSRRLQVIAQEHRGEFAVALTGGSSAAVFYDALAERGVPKNLEFYWSDERIVPPDDPDSNFHLAAEHLLQPGGIEEDRIHAVNTRLAPAECATAYARTIRDQVAGGSYGPAKFPLVILGLGADGHTGSLFPGRDPYIDDDELVRAVEGTSVHPHARVTFTPRLINQASSVWFVITGANKAWAVEQLAERHATAMQVPALVVDPNRTRISIFVDDSATGGRKL